MNTEKCSLDIGPGINNNFSQSIWVELRGRIQSEGDRERGMSGR